MRLLVSAVLATSGLASQARAAGIEETVNGGVALGRAAGYGRAVDFMAIYQNPANLAVLPSAELGGELRLPLFRGCFDRALDQRIDYKTPNPDLDFQGDEYFGNVCNSAAPFPTGNLGWAQSFASGWGWGIGFFSPAANANAKYGKETIVTVLPGEDEQYPITQRGLEYPTRQLLLSRNALAAWLMAGVGWEPIHQLRIGASLGWGFATIHNKNVVSILGGTFADQEVLSDVKAADWFVPRATFSAVAEPSDGFELFASLTYTGDVNGKGTLDLTANGIQGAPLTDCRSETAGPHCRVNDIQLRVPFPRFEATLGLRYASRRSGRERVLDPMKDERWDIALEGVWSQTSHIDRFQLTIFDANTAAESAPKVAFSSSPDTAPLQTMPTAIIPRQWRDTYTLRIGGDYNLIADKLSVRAGLSYQSAASPASYMNIDVFATQRIGLHAGVTYKYGRSLLTVAYMHQFYKSVTTPVGTGKVTEIVSQRPEEATAVNEGYYQASLDVISVQGTLLF